MMKRPGFFRSLLPGGASHWRKHVSWAIDQALSSDADLSLEFFAKQGITAPAKEQKLCERELRRYVDHLPAIEVTPLRLTRIRQIASLFGLSEREIDKLLVPRLDEAFRKRCSLTFRTHKPSQADIEGLFAFGDQIGLARSSCEKIVEGSARSILDTKIGAILADGMISDDEEQSLVSLFTDLRVLSSIDDQRMAELQTAKMRWQVRFGTLPTIDPPILMQRGEVCHYACIAEAFETRERTVSQRYSGVSLRVPIMKGVSFRTGNFQVDREKQEYMHSFGHGTFCITSKRLIFSGSAKGITIPYSKIVDATAYSDGLQVHRATGKPTTFVYGSDHPLLLDVFNRAVTDSVL